jgi:curved DNA-binding protein CbpA
MTVLKEALYDVLNIRSDDGAERGRKAFREGAKANRPNLNAGDPDTQPRFAQIDRANAILRDPELRAIYHRMLEFERQQCRPRSKLVAIFSTAHSIAADAIIGFVLVFVLAGGGYKLFTYLSKTSDVSTREAVTVAAVPPPAPVDAAERLGAVALPKSSPAALRVPVDVAAGFRASGLDAHRRTHHGAERRGRVKLQTRHLRGL